MEFIWSYNYIKDICSLVQHSGDYSVSSAMLFHKQTVELCKAVFIISHQVTKLFQEFLIMDKLLEIALQSIKTNSISMMMVLTDLICN